MQIKINTIINVQAYKHDGTLYRQWNGVKVIENSPEFIVLFMYKTKVAEKSGQIWVVREPVLWFMPKEKYFNTTGLIRKSGTYFYTNIASPPVYEDQTIKFIDYDLDIKAYPGQKTKIVDRKEYEFHKQKFNYGPKLMKKISDTTEKLLKLIKMGEQFFDEDVIDTYIKELIKNKEIPGKLLKLNFN